MQEQNLKRVLLESAGKKGKSQQLVARGVAGLIYKNCMGFNPTECCPTGLASPGRALGATESHLNLLRDDGCDE